MWVWPIVSIYSVRTTHIKGPNPNLLKTLAGPSKGWVHGENKVEPPITFCIMYTYIMRQAKNKKLWSHLFVLIVLWTKYLSLLSSLVPSKIVLIIMEWKNGFGFEFILYTIQIINYMMLNIELNLFLVSIF
jgi:hypothetical protein